MLVGPSEKSEIFVDEVKKTSQGLDHAVGVEVDDGPQEANVVVVSPVFGLRRKAEAKNSPQALIIP